MAITGGIPVEFGQVFPHGAYVVGEVAPINDFEKSTKDKPVQDRDKVSGLPLWQVPVMDGDPEARKGQREITVKIAAEHQPVPPDAIAGLPFRPVEFTGLTVTPWLEERGNRSRIAYSFRASGMQKPGGKPTPAAKDAA
ncbi:MAG TPA: hypothetical protein VIP77_22055 [Jiangellaceae bacterium]